MVNRLSPALAVALTLGVGVATESVSAQLLDARDAVAALSVGDQVRVQAPGTAVELGIVSEVDPSTLYVVEGAQEWVIDIGTIERLEVRRRSIGKNVLIFGAIGGLAGLGANKFRETVRPLPFLLGGAGFGALFGYTQWQWRVTFPR